MRTKNADGVTVRMLFDWLITGRVVPTNPASTVRLKITTVLFPIARAIASKHALEKSSRLFLRAKI
jgi:hypothetical protein